MSRPAVEAIEVGEIGDPRSARHARSNPFGVQLTQSGWALRWMVAVGPQADFRAGWPVSPTAACQCRSFRLSRCCSGRIIRAILGKPSPHLRDPWGDCFIAIWRACSLVMKVSPWRMTRKRSLIALIQPSNCKPRTATTPTVVTGRFDHSACRDCRRSALQLYGRPCHSDYRIRTRLGAGARACTSQAQSVFRRALCELEIARAASSVS